jgi:hypothetical protein
MDPDPLELVNLLPLMQHTSGLSFLASENIRQADGSSEYVSHSGGPAWQHGTFIAAML